MAYLEGARSLRHGAAGWLFAETRRPLRTLGTAPQHYLEIRELECDWLEEVVVALSCEKPL